MHNEIKLLHRRAYKQRNKTDITVLITIISVLILFASFFCGCSLDKTAKSEKANPEPIHNTDYMLDTVCTITVFSEDEEQYVEDAFALCRDYEKLFSRTIPDSDVSKINEAKGEYVEVSNDTIALLEKAIEYGDKSDGLFDVTIGAVSSLWTFSSDIGKGEKASPEEIERLLPSVDYKGIDINGNSVRLLNEDAQLDLGGIAKGFIADRMADFLEEKGVKQAIIDLGGNVVTVGEKASGDSWMVGVRNPFPFEGIYDGTTMGTIAVEGRNSIGTSGTYERFFEENGTRFHHILNPKTGFPVETDLVAVSVVTDLSVDGEGFTTICILLGSEKAKAFLDESNVPAVLVKEDGSIITTSGIDFAELEN